MTTPLKNPVVPLDRAGRVMAHEPAAVVVPALAVAPVASTSV